MRSARLAVVLVVATSGALACIPTPTGGDAGPSGPRSGPLDFLAMVHDRPAIGGDWYLYDEAGGHIIEPLPRVYLLREGSGGDARYAALRVVSYYDPGNAESGRFTLAYRVYDGGWQPEQEWLTPRNVKDDGAFCLDLFAKAERDCASDAWQLQLRATRWLALEGPIVVARPSVHVRSTHGIAAAGDVLVATLEQEALSGLPNPSTLPVLDDGPQASWSGSDWDRARYAPDLPERGMAVGARFLDEGFTASGDVWLLLNARRSLLRFTVKPVTDGVLDDGLAFTFSKVPVDISDDTIPLDAPAAEERLVPVPAAGERAWLSFEEPELVVAHEGGLHEIPAENGWDLALVRADDGSLRLQVSPGAAVYNATARDGAITLDDATLPERTSP